MYTLKDCNDEIIEGKFYGPELSKVDKDTFVIDRVIDEKKEGGVVYVKVAWKFYPVSCASWIPKTSLRLVK
jgi:hypothetical protein